MIITCVIEISYHFYCTCFLPRKIVTSLLLTNSFPYNASLSARLALRQLHEVNTELKCLVNIFFHESYLKTEVEPQFIRSNSFFLCREWLHCSCEQWRLFLLFRLDWARFEAKNTLNRVQPSKIKKIKF
jgi:hypothetical protein